MTRASRLWWWLTTSIICGWCHKSKHRAPLWFLGRASHTMCDKCHDGFVLGYADDGGGK